MNRSGAMLVARPSRLVEARPTKHRAASRRTAECRRSIAAHGSATFASLFFNCSSSFVIQSIRMPDRSSAPDGPSHPSSVPFRPEQLKSPRLGSKSLSIYDFRDAVSRPSRVPRSRAMPARRPVSRPSNRPATEPIRSQNAAVRTPQSERRERIATKLARSEIRRSTRGPNVEDVPPAEPRKWKDSRPAPRTTAARAPSTDRTIEDHDRRDPHSEARAAA
jgi:hypothetical protein